ncbi:MULTISPECIES: hypothetical protein [Providencia]|uniref:hypothetical protein n=1 Tax=Providencia TaxID=586 RepID=UPI00234A20C4|nr:hypothetical protein [Providencia sp. PROV069]
MLGKATGLPVSTLLGGNYRSKVQPYCSLLMEKPDVMHKVILEYKSCNVQAMCMLFIFHLMKNINVNV